MRSNGAPTDDVIVNHTQRPDFRRWLLQVSELHLSRSRLTFEGEHGTRTGGDEPAAVHIVQPDSRAGPARTRLPIVVHRRAFDAFCEQALKRMIHGRAGLVFAQTLS